MTHAPEPAELGSVYWMESSRRRQALEWLRRDDLSPEERRALEAFVARYRTMPGIPPAERRGLLAEFDRVGRRLRSGGTATQSRPTPTTPVPPAARPHQ